MSYMYVHDYTTMEKVVGGQTFNINCLWESRDGKEKKMRFK